MYIMLIINVKTLLRAHAGRANFPNLLDKKKNCLITLVSCCFLDQRLLMEFCA